MLRTQELLYTDGNINCRGFIAFDDQYQTLPAVLIAPDWSGRNNFYCEKAKQLATLGYLGFAIDMYGDGKLGKNKAENMTLIKPFRDDRELVGPRIMAALNCARTLRQVDSTKIAAIGYCFGGACVLDLARLNPPLKGVVSFHGRLDSPKHNTDEHIDSKILVLHGFDDPLVPSEQVQAFTTEMTTRQADWQIHMYGNTQHAFTNPTADDDELGLHYQADADRRSWQSACNFLAEVLG